MKKIVVKFGGSNLREKEDIQRIVSLVKAYNRPLVIVVSAFYGITNFLRDNLEKAQNDEKRANIITDFLNDMKSRIIDQNFEDSDRKKEVIAKINLRLKQLNRFILGVHYIGETPDFLHDQILSYGERLSSLLVSEILLENEIECKEALPEDIGLYTDGNHKNASVDFCQSEKLVAKNLGKDIVYVVPGFYGISKEGRTTLLGRGGSDYSAAAIAGCIQAESLDIWKDVNGYLSGDPSFIENTHPVDHLSYIEAAELSYFGARILHPQTVEPLQERNIPIRLFNITRSKEGILPLSIIDSTIDSDKTVKSIAFSDDFSILSLNGAAVGNKQGILAKVTSALDKEGINIKSVVTSQTSINLYLSEENLKKSEIILHHLCFSAVKSIEAIGNLSIIAIVGEGIGRNPKISNQFIHALKKADLHPRIVSTGASNSAAYIILPREKRIEGIKTIHQSFFKEK